MNLRDYGNRNCNLSLILSLILLILSIALAFINKDYLTTIFADTCAPYNVKVNRSHTQLRVRWQTLGLCKGYLLIKSQKNNMQIQVLAQDKFIFWHEATAEVPRDSLLFVYIKSGSQIYGAGKNQPLVIY